MNALLGNRPALRALLVTGTLFVLPTLLSAHPGHDGAGGFTHGFFHPFSGLDHFCAMIAVGLWGARRGGGARWSGPFAFVVMMGVGAVLGMTGMRIPFVEAGIAASVFVLGLLVASSVRIPSGIGLCLIGIFALFHGQAHGAEMPGAASAALYIGGFLLATLMLHLGGLAFGLVLRRFEKETLLRYAGAAIAAVGVVLVVGQ